MTTAAPSQLSHPLLWQLLDSAFPISGFSHSAGAEAYYQTHHLHTPQQLVNFLTSAVQQLSTTTVPIITATHQCIDAQTRILSYADYVTVDGVYHAVLSSNSIAYRSSVVQGQSLLSVACAILDDVYVNVADEKTNQTTSLSVSTMLQSLRSYLQQHRLDTHFAMVWTVICTYLDVPLPTIQYAFLWQISRQICSSCVRLNAINGPLAAQSVMTKVVASGIIQQFIEQAEQYHQLNDSDEQSGSDSDALSSLEAQLLSSIHTTHPLIDIIHPVHDRLHARMFQT